MVVGKHRGIGYCWPRMYTLDYDSYSYRHRDTHSNCYGHTNSYGHTHCYGHIHCYTHTFTDPYSFTYTSSYTH